MQSEKRLVQLACFVTFYNKTSKIAASDIAASQKKVSKYLVIIPLKTV